MNRRIFIGTDPGTKGACCVLAVADCPADEAKHGAVLAVEVFDLPVVARDNGGHDLDVVTFKVALRTALADVVGNLGGATGCDGLVEYPVLSAGFAGGVRQKVQQGVNAGAVWAAMKATGLVQVGWVDSDKWRHEVDSQKGCEFIEAATVLATALGLSDVLAGLRHSTDQCVAVLLAEVARRRWLGTACAPKKTGAARATKARKADRRKEAIARAVAPLTVAKARVLAVNVHACQACPADRNMSCSPRNKCCEARLLDWAWRAALDLPDNLQAVARAATPNVDPMRTLGGVIRTMSTNEWCMSKSMAVSKEWTVRTIAMTARAEDVCKIPMEVSDVLIDHGLVQLVVGDKRVVYAPTARGKCWALALSMSAKEIAP